MIAWIAAAAASPVHDLLRQTDAMSCADLGEATSALRDELLSLTTPGPSVVPVRAARCLVARFPADPLVLGAVLPWMTDPERAGLALAVLGQADLLDERDAVRLATAALSVADPTQRARVSRRLRPSVHAEVRAIVEGPKAR